MVDRRARGRENTQGWHGAREKVQNMKRLQLALIVAIGGSLVGGQAYADCCHCPLPSLNACTSLQVQCFCDCLIVGMIPVTITFSGGTEQGYDLYVLGAEEPCEEPCELVESGQYASRIECTGSYTATASNPCVQPGYFWCTNDCPPLSGPGTVVIREVQCP